MSEELRTPERYNKGSVECWDFLADNGYSYLLGCAVKYVWRFKDKNGLEDLKKAWYFLNKVKSVPDAVRVPKHPSFAVRIAGSVGVSVAPELVEYGEHAFDWMSEEQFDTVMAIHRLREPHDLPEFLLLLDLAVKSLESLVAKEYGVYLESVV